MRMIRLLFHWFAFCFSVLRRITFIPRKIPLVTSSLPISARLLGFFLHMRVVSPLMVALLPGPGGRGLQTALLGPSSRSHEPIFGDPRPNDCAQGRSSRLGQFLLVPSSRQSNIYASFETCVGSCILRVFLDNPICQLGWRAKRNTLILLGNFEFPSPFTPIEARPPRKDTVFLFYHIVPGILIKLLKLNLKKLL